MRTHKEHVYTPLANVCQDLMRGSGYCDTVWAVARPNGQGYDPTPLHEAAELMEQARRLIALYLNGPAGGEEG